MAEYESIHGTRVKYLTSDPTLDSSYEGQVWYNSTTGTNKALVQIKAWIAGGNMSQARTQVAGAGTQTAALAFGGGSDGSPKLVATESWNGTNWTTVADLGTGRYDLAGAGTKAAGLAFGGRPPGNPGTAATEEFSSGPATLTFTDS